MNCFAIESFNNHSDMRYTPGGSSIAVGSNVASGSEGQNASGGGPRGAPHVKALAPRGCVRVVEVARASME